MLKQEYSEEQLDRLLELVRGGWYGEQQFLQCVRDWHRIGYGRMMQIIAHEWYRAAIDEGLCPPSGVRVGGPCLGNLSQGERADFEAGYRADLLFHPKGEGDG